MSEPAWERPGARFPVSFVRTWWSSLARPRRFFADVATGDEAAPAIAYFLILVVISSSFTFFWSAVFATPFPGFPWLEALFRSEDAERAAVLLRFTLAPFVALPALIVWSAIVHGFVLLVARDRRPFGATLRAAGYAAGPCALQLLPFVGYWLSGAGVALLTVIGIREAHGMRSGAAVAVILLAVLVPAALAAVFATLLLLSLVTGIG